MNATNIDKKDINVALILAGCGHFDGAEIREAILSMLALDNLDVNYKLFSIDQEQHHVINHHTGTVTENESRNVLVESARLGRGAVTKIDELVTDEFDALLIPGGFGVAKNLSGFAFAGYSADMHPQVKACIQDFYSKSKPIGAICIAPAVLALALSSVQQADKPVTLTIGDDEGTANEITQLGAKHQNCKTTDCIVDGANKIVTTPAYMDGDARLKDVNTGITKLVAELIKLV